MPFSSFLVRILLLLGLVALALEGVGCRIEAQPKGLEWFDLWNRGIETTDCEERIRYIVAALEKKPMPSLRPTTRRGDNLDGYFPLLKLSEAHAVCGNSRAAEKYLERALSRRSSLEAEIAAARNNGKRRKAKRLANILSDWEQQRAMLARRLAKAPSQVADDRAERAPEETIVRHEIESVISGTSSSNKLELPTRTAPESSRSKVDSPPRIHKPSQRMKRENRRPVTTPRRSSQSPPPPSASNSNPTTRADRSPLDSESPGRVDRAQIESNEDVGTNDQILVEPETDSRNRDGAQEESELGTIHPSPPEAMPSPSMLPTLSIGHKLTISCRSCQYKESEGMLVIGTSRVRLPRGYATLVFNGVEKPVPIDHTPNYDHDLKAFEMLVTLRESGLLRLPLPEAEASPPTAWMVGTILFWPRARPPHFYEQAAHRFDELVALKTIQYRSEIVDLLSRLSSR